MVEKLRGWDRVVEELRNSGRPEQVPEHVLDKKQSGLVWGIDDSNYKVFLQEEPVAVLVLGTSWCHFCEEYQSVVSRLAKALPQVSFGWAVLDDHEIGKIEIIGDFEELIDKGYPVTVMLKEGAPIGYFNGLQSFEEVRNHLRKNLIPREPSLLRRLIQIFQ